MLKTTFILFVIYITAINGQDSEGFLGYHRYNETGGWLKVHPGPNNYDEAKQTCKDEGGELINPINPKFEEVALKLIKQANCTDGNPLVIYSKTRYTESHGSFVKRNDVIVYLKNYTTYCTLLYPNGTIDHRVSCDQKVGFICYVPFPKEPIIKTTTAKPQEETKEDGNCGAGQEREGSPGYKKCDVVDGWVKMHPGPNYQDEAQQTCDQEGGELIDLDDPKFKEVALKLIKANSTDGNPLMIYGNTRVTESHSGDFVESNGVIVYLQNFTSYCTLLHSNGTIAHRVGCDQNAGFICYVPFPFVPIKTIPK